MWRAWCLSVNGNATGLKTIWHGMISWQARNNAARRGDETQSKEWP